MATSFDTCPSDSPSVLITQSEPEEDLTSLASYVTDDMEQELQG